MRDAARGRPAVLPEHLQRAQVLDQSIRQGTVKLQPVAVAPHAAVANEIARILHRKQVLAGGHRLVVVIGELSLQCVIERVARLLIPEEVILRQLLCVGNGSGQIKTTIGVNGQSLTGAEQFEHGLDTLAIFCERGAPDFLLDHRIAAVEVTLHFARQAFEPLPGPVIAARRIDEHLAIRLPVAIAVGQHLVERQALDLGDRVPYRHVDRSDRHRALAVAPGLLVVHHRRPHLVRADHAVFIEQAVRRGLQHARDEALAHQRALAVAAVRVEAIADHRLAVADHIGDHRDQAQRHLRKIDVGVADVGLDGARGLADFNDLHGGNR